MRLMRCVADCFTTLNRRILGRKKPNVWGTKGFEFWTFLSLLLFYSKPGKILELGAGRSSICLGEYARYSGSMFVSLETDKWWFEKTKIELRAAGLVGEAVHHVRIDSATGWYDKDQFESVVMARAPYDFVLFDAPNRADGDSRGMRDTPLAIVALRRCVSSADTVIVDDVHRRHVLDTVDLILGPNSNFDKYYYDYRVVANYLNTLCVCVRRDSEAHDAVRRAIDMLAMKVYTDFPPSRCPQD